MSQYDDYLASLKTEDDKKSQVVSSLSEAATTNPDEFASMVKLSRAAKIDLEAVPTYKEEAQQAKFLGDVGLDRLWKDSPKTTQFLATPENAKMASDDIPNLTGIEGALNWTANRGRAIAAAIPKMNAGLFGMAAAPFELVGADSIGGWMRDMQQETNATAKRWGPQDKPGWTVNAIDQGLTSFGQNMLTLPMAFLPGGQNAALTAMVAPVFGESYGKGRDAGLSPAQAIQFGTQDASAEYVFERYGLGNLVKNVKSGTGLGKTMVQFMMREVPSEMATTVVQSFDEYANINPGKPVGDWLAQLPDELAQTVVATLVGGSAISASAKAVQKTMQIANYRQQEAQDAERGAGFIETLNKFIGASTTLQRDPETFERFIEQATESGPVENIYINAQTLQQSGIAEQLAQVSPAIAEQFQTAIETGGDIRIPVAEYASKIAPTEFAQSLVDHLKVDENGFSRAEAQEYMQSQGEELQAHIERVMTENEGDTTFKASVETVKENIRSQLDTANRFTSQNNEAFSTLTATFFATTAARLGMTPEALYAKYPLRVVAESIAGGNKFDQAAIETPEFRNWFGDSKVVDADGKPMVVYHGTASDFAEFNTDEGAHFGTAPAANERAGMFMRGNVMPVYLSIKNPKRVQDQANVKAGEWGDAIEQAKADGYDGLVYRNDAEDAGSDSYVVFDPAQIKSATGNRGTFDPNDANILNQPARASFNPATLQMSLLKNADLSSFLHESGHFFLEVQFDIAAQLQQEAAIHGVDTLKEGEQEYLRDTQAVLDWFGIKDIAEWNNLEFEEKRSYHERYAESFEAYLFSGRAPSIELAPLFQKFRAFLTSVYTSLKQFLAGHPEAGKLNEEVIAVFDKMLATNEQIILAEQARSMMPLFDANDGTITPDEYANLQALGIAGTNEAIQELQAKGLRDLQWARNAKAKELRRLQRESKSIRDELTMQARREVMSQPVYQVWSFLTKKQTRDDMTDLEQTRADYREILSVWNAGRKAAEEKARSDSKQEVWASSEEGQKTYRKDGAMLKAQQKVLRREEKEIDGLTDKAMGEWEKKNPKPKDPEARAKSDPDSVDESQDSLFAAIAKLGGINKRELVGTWGIDPADKASSGVFGKHVMRAEDKGMSIDGMVEALSQYGYLKLDENGKADMRELEDKFKSELSGDTQYSNAYDYSADLQASPIINPAALSAGRLDLAGLSEIGLPPDIINHLKSLRMTAKDGLHPDMVAEVVGDFGSGDEMVRAIVSAKPPKEAIADRAQELMEQNHGELANDEAIDREADKAIHNEVRARAVEAELNALAKAMNVREPTGNMDKNGKPITRPVLATAAREFAAQMIGRLKVRDIKPGQYANSEAKAARSADKAKRAGDVAQAMADKRNQLINLYLTRAAYNGQDEAGDIVRYLSKFDREGTRKALSRDYLVQIDAILERFDLRKGQSLKAIDKRESLAKFIESQAEAGIEPEIPDWLVLESNKTHYKNLTLDELRAVNESVRQIEHLGRLKNKLLTAKDARELNEIVQEISDSMIANSTGEVDNEARNEIGSKISQMWRGAMAAHRKAASVVRQMDGFKDGGPMWEVFIRSMNEAGEREASMRADAADRLHALAKPVMEAGKIGGKGKFFPSLNRNLNRGEILAMALNIGNESNLQRLLGGKDWTVGQIKPALDTLTATDWAFVQGVWDFFESYRPQIGAKQMRVYGTEPDWIEAGNPFLQMLSAEKGLNLRGGYYPIKYDPRQSGKSAEFDDKQAAQDMMRAANTAATTRRSFVKSRVEEVKGRPLLLTFDGIWQGANEVIHDLTWHEWLIDSNRLLRRLDEPMRNYYGSEYVEVLRTSVKDSALGDMPASNSIQRGLNHLRIGATVAGLGWNLTTSLLQPIGLTQSVVRIGAPWVARGLKSFYGNPIAKAEEVQAKSEFMLNRGRTFMREINDVRNRLESDKSEARSLLEGSFFVMIQKMQATVDYPTWLGAYEKAIAENNDEARSISLADQAVIDSQGGGQIKDLSQVQRGHPIFKLFTNFYSFFNVALNLSVERAKSTNFKKPAEVAALAGDYLLLLVLPSAIGAVLKSVLKGGDDDEEKFLKKVAEEQIGFLLGLFVGLREITSGVQMALGLGNPGIGYSGPAGARFFAEMQKLGQQIGQGEADMALFKAANSSAGILFHYPAGQVNRAVEGSAALIEGRTNNPLAPLVGPPPKR